MTSLEYYKMETRTNIYEYVVDWIICVVNEWILTPDYKRETSTIELYHVADTKISLFFALFYSPQEAIDQWLEH